jgi:hypothetical protein
VAARTWRADATRSCREAMKLYELDIKGGTPAERKAAMDFAKRYAEGLTYKPSK